MFILNDSYNGYLDQMYEFVVKVNEIDIGDQDKINNNMDKYVRYQEERDKGIGPDAKTIEKLRALEVKHNKANEGEGDGSGYFS